MTVRQTAVVANPSKVDDWEATRSAVTDALTAAGLPAAQWYETTVEDPGRGQTAKAVADGADLVLALGGDGTVRACATELAGTDVPLALLPSGTGNLLARNLAVPLDLDDAMAVAAHGARRRLDLLDLDGEAYAVMGGCGFDALVFEETSDALKAKVGWVAYVVAGVKALRGIEPLSVDIVADDRPARTERAVGVVVANVGTLTGGVELLPDAQPDDGLLDVGVLVPARPRDWVGLVGRLLVRKTPRPFQLRTFTARRVTLTWAAEVPVEVDGDLVDPRRTAEFFVRPAAFTLCVPAD